MNAVCVALNLAMVITFIIGTGVAAMTSSLLFIPVFAICAAMYFCSSRIYQKKSRTAAKIGVALMALLVTAGLLFPIVFALQYGAPLMLLLMSTGVLVPLGVMGLVGAYLNRSKWTAW